MEVHESHSRALAGHAGGYRGQHDDWRPSEERNAYLRGRRSVLHDLWRWCWQRRYHGVDRVPSQHGKLATLTAFSRWRVSVCLRFDGDDRHRFSVRRRIETVGGSTAVSSCSRPSVLDYIEGDATTWEREPMERLAAEASCRLLPSRLLAADGHASRQAATRRALGTGKAPWKTW